MSSVVMFRLLVIASAFLCAMGAPRSARRPRFVEDSRIVGGTEITIREVPYQLSVEEYWTHGCGAAIISANWALTAAHCLDGSTVNNVRVRSGSDRLERGGVLHKAAEIIVHENYDDATIDFDIALIRVATPFVMSVTTATIPLSNTPPSDGTTAFVSGWGTKSSGGAMSKALRGVQVPIVSHVVCDEAYAQVGGITDYMICAGLAVGGRDACQGDSGGPLQVRGQLVGVVSWGLGCGLADYPGVYASVAALRTWIQKHSGV